MLWVVTNREYHIILCIQVRRVELICGVVIHSTRVALSAIIRLTIQMCGDKLASMEEINN